MKLLKNFAIAGSLGLIAFAGLASATTISYDQTLASVGDKAGTGTAAPGFYNGNGNYATDFATLTDGNLQLALRAGNRGVGPTIPAAGDNYDFNDNQGTSHQWDYYFSIDTRYGGGTGTVGDYTYQLFFTDNTLGTTITSNPLQTDDSYYDSLGVHGGSSNSSSLSDQNAVYGVQNAYFPGFYSSFTFVPTHTYTITLEALSTTQGATPDDLTIRVNGTPEPGTILTMLGSLGALGLFVRRRKA
jgi:hypothetical protein